MSKLWCRLEKALSKSIKTLKSLKFKSFSEKSEKVNETRGVMPIQSEGASDFWAKWILNAASKRQIIAE